MWSDGASAGSLLSWSRLTRYSRHTQLVPQSCRAGRDTQTKARKERGMSRDKLTHGDMHTHKRREKAGIRKMDSSTVLPTWKRRTGFILVLFMGEIEDITVYYARKHKTPAIFTPRRQTRQKKKSHPTIWHVWFRGMRNQTHVKESARGYSPHRRLHWETDY